MHAIITYLAMLELLNLGHIWCIPGEGMNNFWVTTVPDEIKAMEDIVHDDDIKKEVKSEAQEEE